MEQVLQVFSLRAATLGAKEVRSYRNFLFVVPEPTSDLAAVPPPDERVKVLAHHLNQNGFAYVARTNQKEMEDDSSGVRYLPLREALPSFGVLTAVIVIRDPAWAARAAATYPETDVFLLKLPD